MKTKLNYLTALMLSMTLFSCQPESAEELIANDVNINETTQNDTLTIATIDIQILNGAIPFYSYKLNSTYVGYYYETITQFNDVDSQYPKTFQFDNRYDVEISSYVCLPGAWGSCDIVTNSSNLLYKLIITTDNPNDEPIELYGPSQFGAIGGIYHFSEE
jgi:hypothetical protein